MTKKMIINAGKGLAADMIYLLWPVMPNRVRFWATLTKQWRYPSDRWDAD
jgi:hypothetical protein